MNRDKSIICSTPEVQSILARRKTMARRVMKPQPSVPEGKYRYGGVQEGIPAIELLDNGAPTERYFTCGKPPCEDGDVLWVRETWTEIYDGYHYKADFPDCLIPIMDAKDAKWRPAIHMPRDAARLFLRVKDVRVKRLQDISEDDARAEGAEGIEPGELFFNFSTLWDNLNAKRGFGWDVNPWVWVISFKVAKP